MLKQGDILLYDSHFLYHLKHSVPVQVYDGNVHIQIGIIVRFNEHFVEIEDTLYNRQRFTFISRAGF